VIVHQDYWALHCCATLRATRRRWPVSPPRSSRATNSARSGGTNGDVFIFAVTRKRDLHRHRLRGRHTRGDRFWWSAAPAGRPACYDFGRNRREACRHIPADRTGAVENAPGRARHYPTRDRARPGHYASVGQKLVSVVDTASFWVDGYFEETSVGRIHEGEPATVKLMGHSQLVRGHGGGRAYPTDSGVSSGHPGYFILCCSSSGCAWEFRIFLSFSSHG
jgi:hypothetical protein